MLSSQVLSTSLLLLLNTLGAHADLWKTVYKDGSCSEASIVYKYETTTNSQCITSYSEGLVVGSWTFTCQGTDLQISQHQAGDPSDYNWCSQPTSEAVSHSHSYLLNTPCYYDSEGLSTGGPGDFRMSCADPIPSLPQGLWFKEVISVDQNEGPIACPVDDNTWGVFYSLVQPNTETCVLATNSGSSTRACMESGPGVYMPSMSSCSEATCTSCSMLEVNNITGCVTYGSKSVTSSRLSCFLSEPNPVPSDGRVPYDYKVYWSGGNCSGMVTWLELAPLPSCVLAGEGIWHSHFCDSQGQLVEVEYQTKDCTDEGLTISATAFDQLQCEAEGSGQVQRTCQLPSSPATQSNWVLKEMFDYSTGTCGGSRVGWTLAAADTSECLMAEAATSGRFQCSNGVVTFTACDMGNQSLRESYCIHTGVCQASMGESIHHCGTYDEMKSLSATWHSALDTSSIGEADVADVAKPLEEAESLGAEGPTPLFAPPPSCEGIIKINGTKGSISGSFKPSTLKHSTCAKLIQPSDWFYSTNDLAYGPNEMSSYAVTIDILSCHLPSKPICNGVLVDSSWVLMHSSCANSITQAGLPNVVVSVYGSQMHGVAPAMPDESLSIDRMVWHSDFLTKDESGSLVLAHLTMPSTKMPIEMDTGGELGTSDCRSLMVETRGVSFQESIDGVDGHVFSSTRFSLLNTSQCDVAGDPGKTLCAIHQAIGDCSPSEAGLPLVVSPEGNGGKWTLVGLSSTKGGGSDAAPLEEGDFESPRDGELEQAQCNPVQFISVSGAMQWILNTIQSKSAYPAKWLQISMDDVKLPSGVQLNIYHGLSYKSQPDAVFDDQCHQGAMYDDGSTGAVLLAFKCPDPLACQLDDERDYHFKLSFKIMGCEDACEMGVSPPGHCLMKEEEASEVPDVGDIVPDGGGNAGGSAPSDIMEGTWCPVIDPVCQSAMTWDLLDTLETKGKAFRGGLGRKTINTTATMESRWACVRDWNMAEQLNCAVGHKEYACFHWEERARMWRYVGSNTEVKYVTPAKDARGLAKEAETLLYKTLATAHSEL